MDFPKLSTARVLNEEEMSLFSGGACSSSCRKGCSASCKKACKPGNKNDNNGNGNEVLNVAFA